MPTVPAATEAHSYFRSVESLLFAISGTLLVLLSIPAIRPNWMASTLAALCAVSVVTPAWLAVGRTRRGIPAEKSKAHEQLRWLVLCSTVLFALLVVACFWLLPHLGYGRITLPVLSALVGLALCVAAYLVRFTIFAFCGIAAFLVGLVPFLLMPAPSAVPLAGLLTGFLLWITSFLSFSRDWRK